VISPLLDDGASTLSCRPPGLVVDHFRVGGQDAQVGVDLGQGAAHETELARPMRPALANSSLTRVR
jgi:hypothetical protein